MPLQEGQRIAAPFLAEIAIGCSVAGTPGGGKSDREEADWSCLIGCIGEEQSR